MITKYKSRTSPPLFIHPASTFQSLLIKLYILNKIHVNADSFCLSINKHYFNFLFRWIKNTNIFIVYMKIAYKFNYFYDSCV